MHSNTVDSMLIKLRKLNVNQNAEMQVIIWKYLPDLVHHVVDLLVGRNVVY